MKKSKDTMSGTAQKRHGDVNLVTLYLDQTE
jgi:hypothetical protein